MLAWPARRVRTDEQQAGTRVAAGGGRARGSGPRAAAGAPCPAACGLHGAMARRCARFRGTCAVAPWPPAAAHLHMGPTTALPRRGCNQQGVHTGRATALYSQAAHSRPWAAPTWGCGVQAARLGQQLVLGRPSCERDRSQSRSGCAAGGRAGCRGQGDQGPCGACCGVLTAAAAPFALGFAAGATPGGAQAALAAHLASLQAAGKGLRPGSTTPSPAGLGERRPRATVLPGSVGPQMCPPPRWRPVGQHAPELGLQVCWATSPPVQASQAWGRSMACARTGGVRAGAADRNRRD